MRVANAPELGAWATGLSEADRAHLDRAGFVATDFHMRARGMPCVILKRLRDSAPPAAWILGDEGILKPDRWDMRLIYSMHG